MESNSKYLLSQMIKRFETILIELKPGLKSKKWKWSSQFYEDISVDIESFYDKNPELKQRLISNYLKQGNDKTDEQFGVSDTTVRRIVKYTYNIDEPLHDARRYKLNIISVYFRFADWEDFRRQSRHIIDVESENLEQHILKAIAAKFEVYKSVPDDRTNDLKDFFSNRTLTNLTRVVKYITKRNYKYDVNSLPPMIKVGHIYFGDVDSANVVLFEKWHIDWEKPKSKNRIKRLLSSKTNDDYIDYESFSCEFLRIYYCKKLNGKWIILDTKVIYKYFTDQTSNLMFSPIDRYLL